MKRNATGRGRAAAKSAPQRKIQPIPSGYHVVTPYLSVRGAAGAIDFYKKALGAKEVMRMPGRNGRLGHAEIEIGDSRVISALKKRAAELAQAAQGGEVQPVQLPPV